MNRRKAYADARRKIENSNTKKATTVYEANILGVAK